MTQEEQQPTAEDMQKAQQVAMAGATAAAESQGSTDQKEDAAKQAMRKEADRVGMKLSDDEIEKIADTFVGRVIGALEDRGAFDPAPEPVQAPTEVPAPPAEQTPAAPPAQPETPPRKPTFAEKFLGA